MADDFMAHVMDRTVSAKVVCVDDRIKIPDATLRTLGNTAQGLDLTSPFLRSVTVSGHEDCGFIKAVAKQLAGVELGLDPASTSYIKSYAEHFKNRGFEKAYSPDDGFNERTLRDMEKFNVEMQVRLVKEALSALGRTDVRVMAGPIIKVEGEHQAKAMIIVLGRPVKDGQLVPYEDVVKAAGVQSGEAFMVRGVSAVDDLVRSVEIGKRLLGVTEIRIVASTPEEMSEARRLVTMPAFQDVPVHTFTFQPRQNTRRRTL